MMKHSSHKIHQPRFFLIVSLVALLLIIVAPPSLVQATTPVAGFGTALDFDGVNDIVSIPSSASLNFSGSTDFTISAWIQINNSSASIYKKDGSTSTLSSLN